MGRIESGWQTDWRPAVSGLAQPADIVVVAMRGGVCAHGRLPEVVASAGVAGRLPQKRPAPAYRACGRVSMVLEARPRSKLGAQQH